MHHEKMGECSAHLEETKMGLRPSEEEEEEERDCETHAQDTRSAEEELSAVVRVNEPPKQGKIKGLTPKGFLV